MEQQEIDTTRGLSILTNLHQAGKITERQYKEGKEIYSKLNADVLTTIDQEKLLYKKIYSSNQEMVKQTMEYTKVMEEQKENETVLAQLQENLNKQQKDMEELKSRKSYLDYDSQDLLNKKSLMQAKLEKREKDERDHIMPELEAMENAVRSAKEDIERNKAIVAKYQQTIDTLEKRKAELDLKCDKTKEENENLQEEYVFATGKPTAMKKMVAGDENGLKKLEEEMSKQREKNEGLKAEIELALKDSADALRRRDALGEEKKEIAIRTSKLNKDIDDNEKEIKKLKSNEDSDNQEKGDIKKRILMVENSKKLGLEERNRKKKEKDEIKRSIAKLEKEINDVDDIIKQKKTELNTTQKSLEEKKVEIEKEKKAGVELQEEINLFIDSVTKKEKHVEDLKSVVDGHKEELTRLEAELVGCKTEESGHLDRIKRLTMLKEKMARTASQANQQARERKEELKVLRLTILDLSKKHQETKYNLDNFIAMYEKVKNQRNKYVTSIQNCSQTIAEEKEKIKILQNEQEILRNENQEKDQSLRDIDHKLKLEQMEKEKGAKEITHLAQVMKEKKEQTTQQGKEIANLELILQSIRHEIKRLISKYEDACENRNYMGIQLIDRNDELCILYEKSNIQESVLKRGEAEIKSREDEIRMLNIELSEKQRELELLSKKVPEIPVLSEKVVSLKAELEQERVKVKDLSGQVEDPEKNPDRIREIDTYIPTPEVLEAKIHVLEERLNSKKEALLEKELVLEEITNLSEKLRKQALEGRKGTLELAEKINEFRAKTTELSRKMLATVAEVSMFQATAMKLEQEKKAKEDILEQANERLKKGLPPTEDSEREWLRMERQKAVGQELKEALQKKAEIDKAQEQLGVKTTAKPRHTLYTSDVTGLFECYGGTFAPFLPTQQGATMRHIRKPVIKDIEI